MPEVGWQHEWEGDISQRQLDTFYEAGESAGAGPADVDEQDAMNGVTQEANNNVSANNGGGQSSKRPRPSDPTYEEIFPSTKRLYPSQSSTQTSAVHNDNDTADSNAPADDVQFTSEEEEFFTAKGDQNFELDLSICPEFSSVDDKMSKLQIGEEAAVEEGDEMQKAAIEHAVNGGNLFLTGKAGTGKSWTSKQIRARLGHKRMYVVAPTGVAVINVNGMTVHACKRIPMQSLFHVIPKSHFFSIFQGEGLG